MGDRAEPKIQKNIFSDRRDWEKLEVLGNHHAASTTPTPSKCAACGTRASRLWRMYARPQHGALAAWQNSGLTVVLVFAPEGARRVLKHSSTLHCGAMLKRAFRAFREAKISWVVLLGMVKKY